MGRLLGELSERELRAKIVELSHDNSKFRTDSARLDALLKLGVWVEGKFEDAIEEGKFNDGFMCLNDRVHVDEWIAWKEADDGEG